MLQKFFEIILWVLLAVIGTAVIVVGLVLSAIVLALVAMVVSCYLLYEAITIRH